MNKLEKSKKSQEILTENIETKKETTKETNNEQYNQEDEYIDEDNEIIINNENNEVIYKDLNSEVEYNEYSELNDDIKNSINLVNTVLIQNK